MYVNQHFSRFFYLSNIKQNIIEIPFSFDERTFQRKFIIFFLSIVKLVHSTKNNQIL